jgi:hypothetical protein
MEKKKYKKMPLEEPSPTTLIDVWEHLLVVIGYAGEDYKEITATHIKAAKSSWKGNKSQFEPRLLCYQPFSSSRPDSFKRKNLFILPIKNGTYILINVNIYYSLLYTAPEISVIKKDNSSLMLQIGDSETSLIDNLRYSGVFERPEVLGEPITHGSLLNGRHRTGKFTMRLGTRTVDVQGVQYEVDACYETQNKILILEGKSSTTEIDSFNIRQLYYPYRVVLDKIGDKKTIICGFIHQIKKNIHIWLYTFDDYMCMNSIRELGHYIYKFSS